MYITHNWRLCVHCYHAYTTLHAEHTQQIANTSHAQHQHIRCVCVRACVLLCAADAADASASETAD